MIISQVFNNNVVLVNSKAGEMVVLGTGIGFSKKAGDIIDESKIKKKYVLEKNNVTSEVAGIFKDMSMQEIDVVFDIISDAKEKLDIKIGNSILPALADHIHYVIARARENIFVKSPLSNEVKYLYPNEYATCLNYVRLLNYTFQINLEDDEACSIVLHFFNAEQDAESLSKTIKETKIVKDIVDIIRMFYGLEFKEKSFEYRRFIIHLTYFAKRVLNNEHLESKEGSLLEIVKSNYQKAFSCVEKIATYIQNTCNYKIGNDEFLYLTIHIQRITEKK